MCARSSTGLLEGVVHEHMLPARADLGRPASGLGAPISAGNETRPGMITNSRNEAPFVNMWNV